MNNKIYELSKKQLLFKQKDSNDSVDVFIEYLHLKFETIDQKPRTNNINSETTKPIKPEIVKPLNTTEKPLNFTKIFKPPLTTEKIIFISVICALVFGITVLIIIVSIVWKIIENKKREEPSVVFRRKEFGRLKDKETSQDLDN
ncbi:hypothetical protein RF11_00867 [Thelohanellus kitauei]|uniref:Uncharacterized protein n=1 Tax=Thelohanellus kitauei TaxID=669202 RepID=A0A0C2N0E7_THEKT|nr:hypothetical protein RF11_00867 [Thelohanellus kitauei]